MSVLDILCLGLLEPAQHGLSQKAVEIARPFGFPITNSMVVTWIVAVGLIVFAQLSTRRLSQVPGGAQNLFEWLVESLFDLLESVIGRHLVERTFWFFATIASHEYSFFRRTKRSTLMPQVWCSEVAKRSCDSGMRNSARQPDGSRATATSHTASQPSSCLMSLKW